MSTALGHLELRHRAVRAAAGGLPEGFTFARLLARSSVSRAFHYGSPLLGLGRTHIPDGPVFGGWVNFI